MQTNLAPEFRGTPEGEEAEAILRACVHCGFCTATCPTYQLLGDERDGPRGRIYLIKQVLEGAPVTSRTQLHLDRCLTCRSCETTCPSGVRYGRLVDIGRGIVETKVGRPPAEAALRWSLRKGLASRALFGGALALGRIAKGFVPRELGRRIPSSQDAGAWPPPRHSRRMVALEGCVQPSIAPATDAALARVLDRVGISLVRAGGGCCAAVPFHLNDHEEAKAFARRNIDAWWTEIERGAEAIVVTASGCGAMVKDYGHLLAQDPAYAAKAARVAALARDTVEVVAPEWKKVAPLIAMDRGPQRVAFHSPCSLQHGMKIVGEVEEILRAIGHELLPVADAHLCCGSAGTYSILQPGIAMELRRNKLAALEADRPNVIATANVGCQAHLAAGTSRPVRHWIELLDERMIGASPAPRR
ncbi:MAG: glycolate oxidase subunit GlcF [Burkholderiales bacterium]|nr:glycolate oxidase subunit GlcF [Burkholderiales bacterium]